MHNLWRFCCATLLVSCFAGVAGARQDSDLDGEAAPKAGRAAVTGRGNPERLIELEKRIEDLQEQLEVIVVTHNLQQAARISHYTGFLMDGKVIEWGETAELFARPKRPETEDYIRGRFG